MKAKVLPYFTWFISGFKIKVEASSFIMSTPGALRLGWDSSQDFTLNSFSKELCVYFISPNSCFTASRDRWEERARMGERILILRGTIPGKQEIDGDTEWDGHQQWKFRHVRLSPLMTVARSERRKRVGGIKQLTWTALWGMWVSLTTASLPNKQALSWQCKTNRSIFLISGLHSAG